MMTVRERILSIRLMEQMENLFERGDSRVEKTEDGTLVYKINGVDAIEAKIVEA